MRFKIVKTPASEICVGDIVEVDCGYGGGTFGEKFCKVKDIGKTSNLFTNAEEISLYLNEGNECFHHYGVDKGYLFSKVVYEHPRRKK